MRRLEWRPKLWRLTEQMSFSWKWRNQAVKITTQLQFIWVFFVEISLLLLTKIWNLQRITQSGQSHSLCESTTLWEIKSQIFAQIKGKRRDFKLIWKLSSRDTVISKIPFFLLLFILQPDLPLTSDSWKADLRLIVYLWDRLWRGQRNYIFRIQV